ncbi:MAG: hypothetical protein JXK07_10800 [Spirochaetes bacterium]|nr:hypothetical protein [Spirochaetota bacterium]
MKKKVQQVCCFAKSKNPLLEAKRSDKRGTFSGYSPETVQTIALEDCASVWTMWFILFCY